MKTSHALLRDRETPTAATLNEPRRQTPENLRNPDRAYVYAILRHITENVEAPRKRDLWGNLNILSSNNLCLITVICGGFRF